MFHRKIAEEIIPVDTKIWNCEAASCNTWVRDNFIDGIDGDDPSCPICKSKMAEATKLLPPIENPLKLEVE